MPVRAVRFSDALLAEGIETHVIEGVPVRVFDVATTIADCFRHRNRIGIHVALQGLHRALRQRKATPAEISSAARARGAGAVLAPYIEVLIADA